jgi:hypothetical protein
LAFLVRVDVGVKAGERRPLFGMKAWVEAGAKRFANRPWQLLSLEKPPPFIAPGSDAKLPQIGGLLVE